MAQTIIGRQCSLTRASVHFVAGFISVLVFHQLALAGLIWAGILPASSEAWSLASTPPFGVPDVISKAFWGGVWAILLGAILRNAEGRSYWIGWIVLGAVALTLVAMFIVTPLKGEPIGNLSLSRFVIGCIVNGAWGAGCALLLLLVGARR